MTKRRGLMSPSQRDRHNARARRSYARKRLNAGGTYTPTKEAPLIPLGADMSRLEENRAHHNETPHERQKRKWRENYAKQAMKTNGRYKSQADRRIERESVSPLTAKIRLMAHLKKVGLI